MNCSIDRIGSVQHPAHPQSVRKLRLIDADEFFAEAEAEEQHVLEMERERCSTTKRDDHVYNAIARQLISYVSIQCTHKSGSSF